jgi:monofunctional biosynthetic peptidoglycan transglycosylase
LVATALARIIEGVLGSQVQPRSDVVADIGVPCQASVHSLRASDPEQDFAAPNPPGCHPAAGGDPHESAVGYAASLALKIDPIPATEPRPSDEISAGAPAAVDVGADNHRALWKRRVLSALKIVALALLGYVVIVLVLIVLYRFVDPPGSTRMAYQALTGTTIQHTWAPLESISPNLIRAVVVAEDANFCRHGGVDLGAMSEAIERSAGGTPRGASTISMQVTKNLFLTHSKSYVRKAIEIPLTLFAELIWPKDRMLEIYLNIAEWGPGVFGAEAAAQHHFRKAAAHLSEREAALLAAVLPNPIVRDAGKPGPQTTRKAGIVQARMRVSRWVADCVMSRAAAHPRPLPVQAPSKAAPQPPPKATSKPAPRPASRPPRDDGVPGHWDTIIRDGR